MALNLGMAVVHIKSLLQYVILVGLYLHQMHLGLIIQNAISCKLYVNFGDPSTVMPRYNAPITLIGCNAVGRASRFFWPPGFFFIFFFYLFFFLILYTFLDCKLLHLLCTLPRCTFTTMSIVHLFVSVLLLYVGK